MPGLADNRLLIQIKQKLTGKDLNLATLIIAETMIEIEYYLLK